MARKLTKKQKAFADSYLETGNRTQSALKVYDTKDYFTAASIGSENLKKPQIEQYLQERASTAKDIIFNIAQYGESDAVKLSAAKDVVDRIEGKAVERTFNVNMPVNTDELNNLIKDGINKFRSKQ